MNNEPDRRGVVGGLGAAVLSAGLASSARAADKGGNLVVELNQHMFSSDMTKLTGFTFQNNLIYAPGATVPPPNPIPGTQVGHPAALGVGSATRNAASTASALVPFRIHSELGLSERVGCLAFLDIGPSLPGVYRSTPVRSSPAWLACQKVSVVTSRAVSHPPSQQPVSMQITKPRSRTRPSDCGVWPTTNTFPE